MRVAPFAYSFAWMKKKAVGAVAAESDWKPSFGGAQGPQMQVNELVSKFVADRRSVATKIRVRHTGRGLGNDYADGEPVPASVRSGDRSRAVLKGD